MFSYPRQRHGPYALAGPSPLPTLLRTMLVMIIAGVILLLLGRWILRLFGAGNELQRTSVLLMVEERGPVNVSLEGGAIQRAEDTLKLYGGDRVSTAGTSHASLLFFDGSRARLGQQTDITIVESARGTEVSGIALTVDRGSLYVQTPTLDIYSGSVLRTVRAGLLKLMLPTGTELMVSADALLQVFRSDGPGVQVAVRGQHDTLLIGEGQILQLPREIPEQADLYAFREPLTGGTEGNEFVRDSRSVVSRAVSASPATKTLLAADILTVTEPPPDVIVTGSTVRIAGTFGTRVVQVRINGYSAILDHAQGTFHQELSLRSEEEMAINVEALDDKDVVLQEIQRTVRREIRKPESPMITSPASSGATYRTSRRELEIRGTAAPGTAGVIVNDYRLQLFTPGSRTWGYLASTELGNLVPGRNVYTVKAVNDDGHLSDSAMLTILLEEGMEGVVAAQGGEAEGAASVATPETLLHNPPLKPGTLTITGPTPGTQHTATGSEILMEGTTDPATASVWVNDYRLQLFKSGKTTWNYIAKQEFRNLKPGRNVYRIVARDSENKVLDVMEYIVEYPLPSSSAHP